MSERCKRTSKRTSKWPSTYVPILSFSTQRCAARPRISPVVVTMVTRAIVTTLKSRHIIIGLTRSLPSQPPKHISPPNLRLLFSCCARGSSRANALASLSKSVFCPGPALSLSRWLCPRLLCTASVSVFSVFGFPFLGSGPEGGDVL